MNATRANINDVTSGLSERQELILDAAKVCFVRAGFDRTTMQDIAREAKMSSPNIYRYFDSKEALVLGLAERDNRNGAFVTELMEHPEAELETLIELFERYFAELNADSARLSMDLWVNATRNPALAEIDARGQQVSRAWLARIFSKFAASPNCDPELIVDAIGPLLLGMIVSRALRPDYDPKLALGQLRDLIEAGLSGRLANPSPKRKSP